MAEQWRIRRGTNTENNAFTGALGEVTMDTDRNEVRLHDGTTQGGKVLGRDYKTNCITEIPQDIKLSLSTNGILVLEMGSKIYIPNGTNTFDTLTLTNDLTATASGNDTRIAFYYNGALGTLPVSQVYSGSTAPTGNQYMLWYDTTNNLVKFTSDSGSTWATNNSLALAVVTTNASQITSIKQVFNGFGYIGSTIFVLPGVKYLMPNGRNTDGTLKNISCSITSVAKTTFQSNYSYSGVGIALDSTGNLSAAYYVYDENTNTMSYNGGVVSIGTYGLFDAVSGRITSFVPKRVFHTVDYSEIAHQTMPSKKYIDLTLGTSGSSYTAPADGYVYLWKVSNAVDQYITLTNRSNGLAIHQWSPLSGGGCAGYIPVSKGDIVDYTYTAGGAVNIFRFIYANGAK